MFDEAGWMGGGMWLLWILLIVVVLVLIKAVAGSGTSAPSAERETPLQILEKRYARGEIDDEEFEHLRNKLEE